MKKMNYEAPVAEMIELNAAISVMTGSGDGGGQTSTQGGGGTVTEETTFS